MTEETYLRWMRVWKWFAGMKQTPELETLHDLLNVLWRAERDKTKPSDLLSFSEAWSVEDLDFANDAEYQKYKREMDRSLGKQPD